MTDDERAEKLLAELWLYAQRIRRENPLKVRRDMAESWTPAERLDVLILAAAVIDPRVNRDKAAEWWRSARTKMCPHCGEPFIPSNRPGAHYRYCSDECQTAVRKARDLERKQPRRSGFLDPVLRNRVDRAVAAGADPVAHLQALHITDPDALAYAKEKTRV